MHPLSSWPALRRRWACGSLLVVVFCLSATGCVRRRLTVRSNPPGALVYVDDREIGVTPVSTGFTYYGTRKLQLFKDGFETITAKHKFRAPWYQLPVLEFIVENLCPFEIRDERHVDFDLIPQQIVPNELLLERGQTLRMSNHQGHTTPLWTAPPAVAHPSPAVVPGQPPAAASPQHFQRLPTLPEG
jgi:hypothetical protein